MTGALLGLVGGLGAALSLWRLPIRRHTFASRVDPYLGGPQLRGWTTPIAPSATQWRHRFEGWTRWAADRLDRLVGGDASVRRRLDQLSGGSTSEFRISQLTWGSVALGGVLGLGLLKAASGQSVAPVALALFSLVAGAVAVLARDRALTRAVVQRQTSMLAEFPAVADLLALSVGAGEGPLGAMQRITVVCRGELAVEFARTLADTRAGTSVVVALQNLADRNAVPVLRRFVDGFIVALERGTPLADVLRAQAADVRDTTRHALIETAARKEIAMMVPVVFLVLPVAVIFALFPGFYGLALTSP